MALGAEVGIGPGDIVLDEDPAPPPKKGEAQPLTLAPMSIVSVDQTVAHLNYC